MVVLRVGAPDISAGSRGSVLASHHISTSGPEIVRWTVGEPGFATPKEILDVAIGELEAGNTKYRGAGSMELGSVIIYRSTMRLRSRLRT